MPGKIKVKILAGRNLPVMDRSGDTTDAYVELKFGNITYKTDVCRKSLNPQWNSEWYRFEVDDAELQDEPLQIRLMDHDTYSANDAIGKVYINLNPLLLPGVPPTVKNIWTLEAAMNTNTGSQTSSVMTGWIPVFDTMHGIRGEVNIIVKVELFSDFNKFRQSSCGVQFFYSPNIPHGYHTQSIHGFVEELVVSDDPEYKWIDKIRTPRASNEARQTLFFKLSGEVQRKIGLKALDLGGNAVIGYLQNFDLEGESGIVARGIGTAVTLVKSQDILAFQCDNVNIEETTFAFFSQSKAQRERTGLDESTPQLPLAPIRNPDSPLPNTRVIRLNDHPGHRTNAPRYSRQVGRTFDYHHERSPRGERTPQDSPKPARLTKSAISYSSLTESVIQDESIRMMLALEDVRGESNRNKLDVRVRNLRKLFSTTDAEIKSNSNPRVNIPINSKSNSARSSIVSICNPMKERSSKSNKATEGIAALLIKSIHSIPLDNVKVDQEMAASPVSNSVPADRHAEEHENERNDQGGSCGEEKGIGKEEIDDTKRKTQTTLRDDGSSEENTPSSDNDFSDNFSLDSGGYDILRDSHFSVDEELETNKFGKILTRAATFPAPKSKSLGYKLKRIDSDTRPLHQGSTFSLAKCLSAGQVSCNVEFDFQLPFYVTGRSDFGERESKREEDLVESRIVDLSIPNTQDEPARNGRSKADTADFNATVATSVSTEVTPLGFIEKQFDLPEEVTNHGELSQACNQFEYTTKDDSGFPYDNVSLENNFDTTSIDVGNKRDDEISCIDETEVSVSAYSLLQSASEAEIKERRVTSEPTADVRKESNVTPKICLKRFDAHDNEDSLSMSTPSLPEESAERNDYDDKPAIDLISKTPSSIESLIQSSSNEVYDVVHKNRQHRMLDLIKIIDTKMMAHHGNNNNGRLKRRKRERAPGNFHKGLPHHRHAHRYASDNFIRVSSIPKDLSLSGSIMTADSSSYKSSLESIITGDPLILSRLRKTAGLSQSKRGFFAQRSAIDSRYHEISSKELTVDTQSSDSFRNYNSHIEMMELKPVDTNPLTPPAPVGLAIHKSRSVCNVREVLDHDDFTNNTNTANMTHNTCVSHPSPDHRQQDEGSLSPSYPLPAVPPMVSKVCQSPATKAQPAASLHRRSSDSDLSVTPKGNSLGTSDRSMGGMLKTSVIRTMNQDALEMLEYPFITMLQYPPGFIIHIGGLVSSRSVKLLERISNLEEPEGRDAWWKEIRMEVRSHARALACNVVIGYREETSICDDVCVLNAYGTAAVINLHNPSQDSDCVFLNKVQPSSITAATVDSDREKSQQKPLATKAEKTDVETSVPIVSHQSGKVRHMSESRDQEHLSSQFQTKCNLCHLPYNESSVPFRVSVSKCGICKRAKVPDVMFTTVDLPEGVPMTGRGCIIQATVCKSRKDLRGELNAKEISDCLPFLEYELHSLLLNKLKVKGMNAIFGLKLQVSVGERLIIGMAVGTAVFLTALPTPSIPQIASGNSWHKEEQLVEIRKSLVETVKKNREFYRLKPIPDIENGRVGTTSDTDESEEELPDIDFNLGTRDTCVLEVDDIEDMDRITLLMDDRPPADFHVVNTQTIPGLDELEIVRNLQMFTQISRAKIPAGQFASMPSKYFTRLLQSVYFKLRRMVPCALCDMQFKLALPEPDEIQFTVIGMALGLGDPIKMNNFKKKLMTHSVSKDQVKKSDDSDMIFSLDVDHAEVSSDNTSSNVIPNPPALTSIAGLKCRPRSPLRLKPHATHRHKHVPLKGRYGVDITPLSYLPGGRIERYLGNLNFFFIRESTSIRENGGLSGFTHSFVMEVLAIVRAHITALGGNAMVAFFMTKCVLLHSPHKNQGQCLINVGGDVVTVSYYADEKHSGTSNC